MQKVYSGCSLWSCMRSYLEFYICWKNICKKAAKKPFAFPGELEKRNFVFEPEKMRSVDASALIQADFYGIEIENGRCLPGPFAELDPNRIYDIDPRKK